MYCANNTLVHVQRKNPGSIISYIRSNKEEQTEALLQFLIMTTQPLLVSSNILEKVCTVLRGCQDLAHDHSSKKVVVHFYIGQVAGVLLVAFSHGQLNMGIKKHEAHA